MSSPSDRVYSETHEWHQVSGDVLTIGLTQFAVDALTDVTYVQMKPPGTKFSAAGAIGEVESVKTTSDVYCACAGEIAEVNAALAEDPGLLNRDPYGAGWLAKIRITDPAGLSACKGSSSYDASH